MQNRQHRAISCGIEKLVRMPRRGHRSGLGLAVADDAGDNQLWIVEHRAVGVRQGIAELTAFVDRARRLRRGMARDATRKAKLFEEALHAALALPDVRVDFAV